MKDNCERMEIILKLMNHLGYSYIRDSRLIILCSPA